MRICLCVCDCMDVITSVLPAQDCNCSKHCIDPLECVYGWQTVCMLSWLHVCLLNFKSMVKKIDSQIQWQLKYIQLYWNTTILIRTKCPTICVLLSGRKHLHIKNAVYTCSVIHAFIWCFSFAYYYPTMSHIGFMRSCFIVNLLNDLESFQSTLTLMDGCSAILPVADQKTII